MEKRKWVLLGESSDAGEGAAPVDAYRDASERVGQDFAWWMTGTEDEPGFFEEDELGAFVPLVYEERRFDEETGSWLPTGKRSFEEVRTRLSPYALALKEAQGLAGESGKGAAPARRRI